jgi:putative hydrolase of the HAD superfamily
MIQNIVFDMGMVLVEFDWPNYLKRLPIEPHIKELMVQEALGNAEVWNEHDRGVLSDEEFIAFACRNKPEIEQGLRMYMEGVGAIITEYDYSKEWLHTLKEQGYGIYILSNYGAAPYRYAREHFTYFDEADGIVVSSDVKMIKPEDGIYRYLLDTYHLKPEETVFLDDREDNIATARRLGMKGILFENYEQAKAELEILL